VNRGFDAKIKPELEMPLAETHCISCGQCVETCPTGAIIDKVDAVKPGPWILESKPVRCQYCSIGCSMQADLLEGKLLKISADKNAEVNKYGNLCMMGRYGFRYVNDDKRLKKPLIRKNGDLQEVSWDEALDYTTKRIAERLTLNEEWAVFGSPHATNEENYLLQKFARTILKTNHIGSFSNLNVYPEQLLRASMSNTKFKRFEESDFIMICNFDPLETHPVLYMELQKAARRGQTVFMGCCPDSRLAKKSNSLDLPEDKKVLFLLYLVDRVSRSKWYEKIVAPTRTAKKEDIFSSVAGLSRKIELSEFGLSKKAFEKFFNQMLGAQKPVFLCHRDMATPDVIHWLNSLGYVLGQSESFLSLPGAVNFQGMLDMGVLNAYLPGYQRVDNIEVRKRISEGWDEDVPSVVGLCAWKAYEAFNRGKIKNMFIWNQDPVGTAELPLKKKEESFLIVADMFLTETGQKADIVLPLNPFMENSGSITNAEARILRFAQAIEPITERENWSVLNGIGQRLHTNFRYDSIEQVTDEILEFVPEYRKEFAIFRDGYIPNSEILQNAVHKTVPFGANYLQKWVTHFSREYHTRSMQKNQAPIIAR
jgi:formate dehydrogenase major subunit